MGKSLELSPRFRKAWFAAAWLPVAALWLASPAHLGAQARPSPDPAPVFLLLTMVDQGEAARAERQMRDNVPVTKSRLEDVLTERDTRFDELGRFGATSGHEVHKGVLNQFMEENERYLKLFDVYLKVSGDELLYKRFLARKLRYEGAYYTHSGEDECGDHLDWEHAREYYSTALEKLAAAFQLAREVNDIRLMASSKINEGSTLIRMLEPERAIAAYNEGMRYADQLPGEMYKGMVRMNMGNTYVWIGEPEKSFEYGQAALESFNKMGRGTWQANAVMVIGNAQMQMRQFATAWETLRSALDLAIQSGEDRVRGKALMNLGALALMLGRPEAITYLEQAREWYTSHGDIFTEIERETILQDSLMLMSRAAEQGGNEQGAERYKQEFLRSMADNPERYNLVRESPCYALYKARPANQATAR